jgi:hypothetical protein
MPEETYSPIVEAILSALLVRRGEAEITADEAKNLFGGDKKTTLNDLNKSQLIQVCLLEAYAIIEDMIAEQAKDKVTSINRATKRAKK